LKFTILTCVYVPNNSLLQLFDIIVFLYDVEQLYYKFNIRNDQKPVDIRYAVFNGNSILLSSVDIGLSFWFSVFLALLEAVIKSDCPVRVYEKKCRHTLTNDMMTECVKNY